MTRRHSLKKQPRYLDEVTFTVADNPWQHGDEPFCSNLFLGRYSEERMMRMLEKCGLVGILHRRGYRDLIISIARQEDFTSRLYVNYDRPGKDTRLIELILKEAVFRPRQEFVPEVDFSDGMKVLLIEWLALQDPRLAFGDERPRLPGQVFPGLGGLRNIHKMFTWLAWEGDKDALMDVPEHYHTAVIYSRMYSFFSPVDGGRVRAMMRDLKERSLADVSFSIAFDCLVSELSGEREPWRPSEQICPISKRAQHYVSCPQYARLQEESYHNHNYHIDWERYEQLLQQGYINDL